MSETLPKQVNLFTKRASKPKPNYTPEKIIQESFFYWLRMNERRFPILTHFFAIPNGGKRDLNTAVALKRQGVRAGVLDTCLPVARNGFVSLWFEFKREDGKLSDAQKEWLAFLESEGHSVHVLKDWRPAANLTIDYLSLELQKIIIR